MATVSVHPAMRAGSVPLVLLAPFPFDSRIWADAAAQVDATVYAVDPPGFGGEVDDAPSIDGYARAVLDALDRHRVDRFVVAGNSMGGYVAMSLAALAPERIAAIGLLGTKPSADGDEARANRIAMAERAEAGEPAEVLVGPLIDKLVSPAFAELAPERLATLQRWLAEAPTAGISWAQRAMAGRPDQLSVLVDLPAPGIVAIGRDDSLMPMAEQHLMASAVGSLVELPCGHLVPFERPASTADLLRELLRSRRMGDLA